MFAKLFEKIQFKLILWKFHRMKKIVKRIMDNRKGQEDCVNYAKWLEHDKQEDCGCSLCREVYEKNLYSKYVKI